MATWYPCSTPYGAYSVAESAERRVSAGLVTERYSSAASAIGNDRRFSVSLYLLRIWPEHRQAPPGYPDGVDGIRWFGPAAGERVRAGAGSAR